MARDSASEPVGRVVVSYVRGAHEDCIASILRHNFLALFLIIKLGWNNCDVVLIVAGWRWYTNCVAVSGRLYVALSLGCFILLRKAYFSLVKILPRVALINYHCLSALLVELLLDSGGAKHKFVLAHLYVAHGPRIWKDGQTFFTSCYCLWRHLRKSKVFASVCFVILFCLWWIVVFLLEWLLFSC